MKPQPLKGKMDDKLFKCERCGAKYCTYEENYFKKEDIRSAVEWLNQELEDLFNLASVIQGIDEKSVENTHNLIKQVIWEAFEDVMKEVKK